WSSVNSRKFRDRNFSNSSHPSKHTGGHHDGDWIDVGFPEEERAPRRDLAAGVSGSTPTKSRSAAVSGLQPIERRFVGGNPGHAEGRMADDRPYSSKLHKSAELCDVNKQFSS